MIINSGLATPSGPGRWMDTFFALYASSVDDACRGLCMGQCSECVLSCNCNARFGGDVAAA
ncbi:hypothetical protein R75465_07643 [Paraburkholderia aspalathi]|nr:hypothetical protein R75465_07643 [Paraburkholderia aspalathi]